MSKVEKRIGLLYPAMYGDEVNILHTMVYTSDGRFRPECMKTTPRSLGVLGLVEHIQMTQAGELPYDLFIVDAWGSGMGIVQALKDRGMPVLIMSEMFKAVDRLVDGDLTKLEPGRPERAVTLDIVFNKPSDSWGDIKVGVVDGLGIVPMSLDDDV